MELFDGKYIVKSSETTNEKCEVYIYIYSIQYLQFIFLRQGGIKTSLNSVRVLRYDELSENFFDIIDEYC